MKWIFFVIFDDLMIEKVHIWRRDWQVFGGYGADECEFMWKIRLQKFLRDLVEFGIQTVAFFNESIIVECFEPLKIRIYENLQLYTQPDSQLLQKLNFILSDTTQTPKLLQYHFLCSPNPTTIALKTIITQQNFRLINFYLKLTF